MTTIKSVIMTGPGTYGFGHIPKPVPAADQFLIKVDSAVINPSDILFITGKTGAKVPYPFTPGWEGSGVIEALGTDVAEKFGHLLGKRVGFTKQKEPTYTIGGAFAEYAVTDFTSIIPLRDETSIEAGVALFVNPLSAICLIDRIKVLNSEAVIITAAASQLGRMLIKLAAKEGIKTINVVRRPEQAEFLRNELKAEYVVDSSAPDYKERLTELSQLLKPTTCLECISGNTVGEMLGYLSFNSTLILYGVLSEQPAGGISTLKFLGFNQRIESFMLPQYLSQQPRERRIEFALKSEQLCTSDLQTVVQKRFGFHQIEEAIKFYQENQTAGKVLLKSELTE